MPADVYSPFALGATVNEQTLPRLKAKVICGAANNQLANNAIGDEVQKRGILYAPDYLVNAGGIINVVAEHLGESTAAVEKRVRQIPTRLAAVFDAAEESGEAPNFVADSLARSIVAKAKAVAKVAA